MKGKRQSILAQNFRILKSDLILSCELCEWLIPTIDILCQQTISMEVSLDYNYQNPSLFLLLILIRDIDILTPVGLQNLNNERNSDSCSQMTISCKSATTKRYLGISKWLVMSKVRSISAISKCVFLNPLVSILSTLGGDSCDRCLDSQVNLKPLIVVLPLCYPGSFATTFSTEVKPGIFRAGITVIL